MTHTKKETRRLMKGAGQMIEGYVKRDDCLQMVKKNAPYLYSAVAPLVLMTPEADVVDKKVAELLEKQLKERVEVVRCKDCKYCHTLNHDLTTSYFCEVLKRPAVVEPTDFCSHGERKDGAGE